MDYILVHVLPSPAKESIQQRIEYIMKNFNVFDMSGVDPHITLKYYFSEEYLPVVEKICKQMAKVAPSYKLKGYGNFGKRVVFLKVQPSKELSVLYEQLFKQLKASVPLDKEEVNGIHFHVTLAQNVASKDFDKIMDCLAKDKLAFHLKLDNLTILKFTGEEFLVHKTYILK